MYREELCVQRETWGFVVNEYGSATYQQVGLKKPHHPGESPESMSRQCHEQSSETWIQPDFTSYALCYLGFVIFAV